MGTSAIIAAYNEEKTLAEVLGALTQSRLVDEIIVVSDGSTDRTVEIAFFVDGDMFDLTQQHIEALLLPVLRDQCDMNIGVRHRGPVRNFLWLQMKVGPVLSGIRVMRREVWETVPLRYQDRFKIEASLNFFCSLAGFRQRQTIIHNLGHLIKENKRGLMRGLSGRWDMVREVFLLHWDLYVFETWRSDVAEPEPLPAAEYDLFE